MDRQRDGCAQGCVKEGALQIGFLSPLPLRLKAKNNRKVEGSLRTEREGRSLGALSEEALNCGVGSFSPSQIAHPITPPWLHLALATKVEGWLWVVDAEEGDTYTHTQTQTHLLSRQAVTARLECRDEVLVHQM